MKNITRLFAVVMGLGIAGLALPVSANDPLDRPYTFPNPPEQPSLNFYGLPGLIDMPAATPMPDGQVAVSVSHFGGQTRSTLSFQFSPRISASFRYIGIEDFNDFGFETFRDRSFDVRYLLVRERDYIPAVTVGLQDLAGTGIYASEYIVATKNTRRLFGINGPFRLTAGLGWGRLGSAGEIGTPFGSSRPEFNAGDTGGEPSTDQWFRGPVAPFGGIEWQATDRLGLKLEYSSDAYEPETSRGVFSQSSRLNFGAEYQYSDRLRVGAYYMYGSELGVSFQWQLNPRRALTPLRQAGPRPITVRPDRNANPDAWASGWAASETASAQVGNALATELAKEGLTVESVSISATQIELRFSNQRYYQNAIAIGRAARVLTQMLPASVETFHLTPVRNNLALSTVTLQRRDLESLEFQPNAASELLASADISDAAPDHENGVAPEDAFPRFAWTVGPYISPSYFDPDQPARADFGVSAQARYRPAPGWLIAGEVRARAFGNVEDGRLSNSVLPRVRSNGVLYARATDTPITNLYVARQWKPTKDTYARVTTGYLESMFGGVSAEVLWKPTDSRLGVGVEMNYVKQRDFDQRFGFQDYDVFTGHLSAYYEFGDGYLGQIDVGRYLAGDVGATFTLSREFANGWKVGGFFTLTDVTSEEFGEGSFDKGISLTIPVNWFLGRPTRQSISTTIRPIQRDGGARLSVPGRLYQQVREGHQSDLVSSWGRVWE